MIPRRIAIQSALASLVAPFASVKASRGLPEPGVDATPMIFRFGSHHVRVNPVGRTLELADRRDLFGHLPDPEPVETRQFRPGDSLVVHLWGDADPSGSCSRCRWSCGASRSQAGDFRCIQHPDA